MLGACLTFSPTRKASRGFGCFRKRRDCRKENCIFPSAKCETPHQQWAQPTTIVYRNQSTLQCSKERKPIQIITCPIFRYLDSRNVSRVPEHGVQACPKTKMPQGATRDRSKERGRMIRMSPCYEILSLSNQPVQILGTVSVPTPSPSTIAPGFHP
ncbi:hypothetical protein K458DRAFT_192122 [Lentithecium fluviatile CBS 122367]|uniref:Uncharacterized protein n=1 Tax=Lentithecium fluviatile CBS 122367 TaxID=1168545 RepID=A0A6G1JBM4_9PLEO|nr:hypothetical protein K458DRAFT_192122 [Lentithecium fluviatile CBS 122367]